MRARTNALVCASLHGTLSFFLRRVVSYSTRRSQSVKLGYVCSLWHARSESLGNRTLISFFFPSFLVSFFSFFPSRFPLSLSRQLPAIRSPQGKLVFSIARRRAGTKTRGYSQPSRSSLFSKQEPRLYSRGMQVHRLIAKEEQFVDPSPALNCFGFSLNRSRVTLSNFAARPKSVPTLSQLSDWNSCTRMAAHYPSSFTHSKSCRSSRRALFPTIIQPSDNAIILNDLRRCHILRPTRRWSYRVMKKIPPFPLFTPTSSKSSSVNDTRRKFWNATYENQLRINRYINICI